MPAMEELTVKQVQDRQFKIKQISKGVAFVLVGAFICWLGSLWGWIIGSVFVVAGIGMVMQASKIKL